MKSYIRKALPFYVFALSVLGLLLIPSFYDTAIAQPDCGVTICKSAPQLPPADSEGELVFFPFTEIRGQSVFEFTLAANSRCTGAGLDTGQSNEIIEEPFEGWELVDIDCEGDPGIVITLIEDGVSAHCQSQGFTICTFTNRRVPAVPTMSEWGMMAAAGGLALIGVFFAVRRKRRAQAV